MVSWLPVVKIRRDCRGDCLEYRLPVAETGCDDNRCNRRQRLQQLKLYQSQLKLAIYQTWK